MNKSLVRLKHLPLYFLSQHSLLLVTILDLTQFLLAVKTGHLAVPLLFFA